MAEILAGQTQHSHLAPLTHGQTLAITKHLQELIAKVDTKVAELSLGLDQTNAGLADTRESVAHTNAAVHALQDGLTSTNQSVGGMRKDLLRAHGSLQVLQGGLQSCSESIAALTEGHRITATCVDQCAEEGRHTKQLALQLQESVEKKLSVGVAKLREDLGKSNLELRQLRLQEEKLKATVLEERDRLRATDASQKALQDDLNKTNTMVNIVEHRVADTLSSLKTARQNLEDLNEVTVKLHEHQEKIGSQVLDLQSVTKKSDEKLKEHTELIEQLSAGHRVSQARLAEALAGFDSIRKEKDDHRRQLQNLQQSQEQAQNQLRSLRTELADVDSTTRAVKEGLRETSSLLLPNIHLDSSEARSASMRHGSLLQTNVLFAAVASPRKTAHTASRGGAGMTR